MPVNPYRDTSDKERANYINKFRDPIKKFLDREEAERMLPNRLMKMDADDRADLFLDQYLIQLGRMALFSQNVFETVEELGEAVAKEYGHLDLDPKCLGYAVFLMAANRAGKTVADLGKVVFGQFFENECEKWIIERRGEHEQVNLDADDYFD